MTTCVCDNGFYNTTWSALTNPDSWSVVKCYEPGQRFEAEDFALKPTDTCMPCEGMNCITCKLEGTTMQPGFSLSTTKMDQGVDFGTISGQRPIFPCPGKDTCLGTLPPFAAGEGTCKKGSAGPLCSICQDGWSHPGLQGECAECSDTMSIIWILFGGILAIAGVTGVLYFVSGANTSAGKLTVIIALGAPPLWQTTCVPLTIALYGLPHSKTSGCSNGGSEH